MLKVSGMGGMTQPSGHLDIRKVLTRNPLRTDFNWREVVRLGYPRVGLSKLVNEWREANWPSYLREAALRLKAASTLHGLIGGDVRAFSELYLALTHEGRYEFFGLASVRVVTTAGVGFLVDALQNIVEPEIMKFHGVGTGTNAEASADTAHTRCPRPHITKVVAYRDYRPRQ